jgi:hypothetical protein
VQSNKAIVGRNAFAHEAGIHQDGMLKDSRTYEIMKPQDVGQMGEQMWAVCVLAGRLGVGPPFHDNFCWAEPVELVTG